MSRMNLMKPFIILPILAVAFQIPPVFAKMEASRVSYWATEGENLVEQEQEIAFIERRELFDLLKSKQPVIFVDTREAKEYQVSHLPNALNMPFSKRHEFIASLTDEQKEAMIVPYCNWDFRAYVSALELKKAGIQNLHMMYPHGLRGWEAAGLPLAGESIGQNDAQASAKLDQLLKDNQFVSDVITKSTASQRPADAPPPETRTIEMRILKTKVEPRHIKASVGERLILNLHAEEEDHHFVIPL